MAFNSSHSLLTKTVLTILGIYVLYICCVGLFSTVSDQAYQPPAELPKTDKDRAAVMADALVQPIDGELHCLFGWLPNDLFPVPQFIDNKTNFQRGVIYAIRSASDVLAHQIARYGERDTVPPLLVDATAKYFAYADNVWGWWWLYDTESRYKAGVKNWRRWAELVGIGGKNGQIYNMTTNDVVAILNWCIATTDYALGMLNDENVGHFRADDVVYYVKGVCYVVDNILEALLICDESIATRGGKENVDECQKRFNMISSFNPIYVVAGSYGVGDSFWPNHIAALARHVDVVNNRLSDIRHAMMN
ncbi:MAG: DUF2333 family protein [Desulfovibrio sp.]|nr:DUF2333 family protein [Desulfovibrio sp.]